MQSIILLTSLDKYEDSIMSYLILKHLSSREIPTEWAKRLPTGQTFTVSIVPESNSFQSSSFESTQSKDAGTYLRQWKENFFDPS